MACTCRLVLDYFRWLACITCYEMKITCLLSWDKLLTLFFLNVLGSALLIRHQSQLVFWNKLTNLFQLMSVVSFWITSFRLSTSCLNKDSKRCNLTSSRWTNPKFDSMIIFLSHIPKMAMLSWSLELSYTFVYEIY